MANKIQLRRDTAANWTAANPVLAQGEPGVEIDTSRAKYGDGVKNWQALPYAEEAPFLQDGTGAQPRPVASKLKDVVDVRDFSSLAQAFAHCIAARSKLVVPDGQTIVIPTDCPTLQNAFDVARSEGQIVIRIAAGATLSSGLKIANGDWSNFTINSADAKVNLGPGFGAEEDLIEAFNAACPRIATVFDGQSLYGRNGFYLQGSTIYVNELCGVINIGGTGTGADTSTVHGGGIVLIRSSAYARKSRFTGNKDINFFCTQGSQAYGDFGTYTGAMGDANVYVGRGSTGSFSYSHMNGATAGSGLRVRRSICVAMSCQATGNAGYGILAEEGAYVVANNQSVTPSDFSNNGDAALKVSMGSVMDARGFNCTAAPKGLILEGGSTAVISSCKLTTTNTGIDATDSTLVLANSTVSSATRGIQCARSTLNGTDLSVTTSANEAIYATSGSILNLPKLRATGGARGLRLVGSVKAECPNCSITGWTTAGVDASNISSVNLYQGAVTSSGTAKCITLARGCTVLATSCATTNGVGAPAIGDTNLPAFNALSPGHEGVIYN